MKRNMKEWMYKLLNSPERSAMPIITYPGADIVGLGITDIVKDARAQFECVKAIAARYPSAAAVTCMDLSVEAEAFGSRVEFGENEIPTVIEGVILEIEEAEKLEVPDMSEGRVLEYVKAAGLAASSIKDRPTFAGMIGPVSLAGRLFNMTDMMVSIMIEPELMHILLEKSTEYLVEYAKAFKEIGANGIIIAEPAAGLLSPKHCQEFSSNYVKRIVDAVQDDNFMVILHNCGNTANLVESMLTTGSMGYHFGNAVDMSDIMPQIPWGRIAFGNIDPAGIMKNGSVNDVMANTKELLWKTATYKNFVISTGCDVPAGTPPENIKAFFEELERFNSEEIVGETA